MAGLCAPIKDENNTNVKHRPHPLAKGRDSGLG